MPPPLLPLAATTTAPQVDAQVARGMGVDHVKGILLYGPPGTGKSLVARRLGRLLNSGREPRVVNGPEVLQRWVGQSEENIRLLFADAEREFRDYGDAAGLHVIIFDEVDALCRARGSSSGGSQVGDSIVNQLLTKIDGVESVPNVLVIGITNRKDLLDDALLRPGRLEVHVRGRRRQQPPARGRTDPSTPPFLSLKRAWVVHSREYCSRPIRARALPAQMEVGLPDADGRLAILRIHTESMRQAGLLSPDVDLPRIAAAARNFSGAELAGLVRSAASFAMDRLLNPKDWARRRAGNRLPLFPFITPFS